MQPVPEGDGFAVLVPRVTGFANQYVTKATAYNEYEGKISSLSVLVFDKNGAFLYLAENSEVSENQTIKLNQSMLNAISTPDNLNGATVVMIANISLDNIKNSSEETLKNKLSSSFELDDMEGYTCHLANPVVKSEDITSATFPGFPMIGGATVDLTASSIAESISLKILYAKVNFEIGVDRGNENNMLNTNYGTFSLTGYSVNDVATDMTFDTTEGATVSASYTSTTVEKTATTNIDGNKSSFTFYVPENRYVHNCDLSTIYPDPDATDAINPWLTTTHYDHLKQQYKPVIAETSTANGSPSYVVVSGSYIDYRGTTWYVDYTVYLGKDNHSNFEVDRNSEYTNILTIKGIRNNSGFGDAYVWIDHRVDVELGNNQGADGCVTITRETLIDAHVEVRPLRINLAGSNYTSASIYFPKYPIDADGNMIHNTATTISSWSQVDEIMGGQNENWIAIENNNGASNRGRLYLSNGKRRYFTTSLIEELHSESYTTHIDDSGNKYISLADGDCAWIYFDENGTSNTRRAKIDVVFYPSSGNPVTESYDVYQSGYTVIDNSKVENYEEYLHSYDSEDRYNLQTSFVDYTQQGLSWGLMSEKLSSSMLASPIELSPINLGLTQPDPKDYISEDVRYDYFHENDGNTYYIYNKNGDTWEGASFGAGLDFTNRAANAQDMTVTDMGTVPLSAYEYCLSKNKFHEDGDGNHSMIIHWYLPDVYELSKLFSDTYTSGDMAKDSYYWSSQPSSTTYGLSALPVVGGSLEGYSIKNEVTDKARAVSRTGAVDTTRTAINRIRCFYDATGKNADMSDRVPSGLGGIIKVPMTVKNNGFFNYNQWLTNLGSEPVNYPADTYRFPMGDTYAIGTPNRDDADSYFEGSLIQGVHYYAKNPLDKENNWGRASAFGITTYDAMNPSKWPGLSEFVAEEAALDRYRLTDTPKKIERSVTTRYGSKIEGIPSNVNSVPLDHNEGSNLLFISFGKGTGSNNPNYEYYYEDASAATKEVWRKTWVTPTYSPVPITNASESYSTPEQTVTFPQDNNSLKEEIEDKVSSLLGDALSNEKNTYLSHTPTWTTSINTIYAYDSRNAAETAAKNRYTNEINADNEYVSYSISTSSQSFVYCTYTYTYQKWKRDWKIYKWGDWYTNGTGTGSGTLSKTLYTYTITCKKPDGTFYQYDAGTGGWSQESKLNPEQVTVTVDKENIDLFTLYGGNTLTLTAADNCKIKSIKVHYSGNNNIPYEAFGNQTASDNRFLRMVDGNALLPLDENLAPQYMSYSGNGETGWFQWTSPEAIGSEGVTLQLATYTISGGYNLGLINRPSSFQYIAPSSSLGYQNDLSASIIIDSIEVRVEEL